MKCNQCKSKVKLIFESKTDKELELICSQCLWGKIKKGLQEANNLI